MAAETVDITAITDEDVLRRMWQQAEDFSHKKDIRARMYKLREQRLREFYTTGEVLTDVRNVTPQVDENSAVHFIKSSRYTASSGHTMTHADSLQDQGFLAMKTKEIRDSESPTRDLQMCRRHDDNAQSYWKMESSSGSYQAVGSGGQFEVTSQSQRQDMSGQNDRVTSASSASAEKKSVIDKNGAEKIIYSNETTATGRDALKSGTLQDKTFSDVQESKTEVVGSQLVPAQQGTAAKLHSSASSTSTSSTSFSTAKHVEQSSVTTQRWSSSSSSSSKTASAGTVVSESVTVDGTQAQHSEVQNKTNFSRGSKNQVVESHTSTATEKLQEQSLTGRQTEVKSTRSEVTESVATAGVGLRHGASSEVLHSATTRKLNFTESSAEPVSVTEITVVEPSVKMEKSDVTNWQKVSSVKTEESKAPQGLSSVNDDKKPEFVYEKVITSATQDSTRDTLKKDVSSRELHQDSNVELVETETPASVPREPARKPSAELQLDKGDVDYTTTYRSAFTPTRISVDLSATHAQFASSLRAPSLSPERAGSPTKSYSDTSDRRSPTKSLSKSSLDRSSPSGRKPSNPERRGSAGRQSKSPSPTKALSRPQSPAKMPKQRSSVTEYTKSPSPTRKHSAPTPSGPLITTTTKTSDKKVSATGKEKRKLSSCQSRTVTKKRSGTPGASPSSSPVRDRARRGRSRTSSSSSTSTLTEADTAQLDTTQPDLTQPDTAQPDTPQPKLAPTPVQDTKPAVTINDFINTEKLEHSDMVSVKTTVQATDATLKEETRNSLVTRLRENSPEYSSDGSLIQELNSGKQSPKKPAKKSSTAQSPSSSPERKGFTPIQPSSDSPDTTASKKITAPAPSPASPAKKVNGVVTDSETEQTTIREKIKPIKPITQRPKSPGPRKSYSPRSSSVSPYSSPDRKSGGSPDRARAPSSSGSSPDRKSPSRSTVRAASPTKKPKAPVQQATPQKKPDVKAKKELTEYPSQRRFPEKEKPVNGTTQPTKPAARPSNIPRVSPKASPLLSRKHSERSVTVQKSTENKPASKPLDKKLSDKKMTLTERRRSEKTLPQVLTKATPPAVKPAQSSTPVRTVNQVARKPEVPKQKSFNQKAAPQPAEKPSSMKAQPKTTNGPASRTPSKATSPVRSAFARTDSSKRQELVKKSSNTNIKNNETRKKTEQFTSALKTVRKEEITNFINREVQSETNQKRATKRDIMEFNWDDDVPPSEFLVDDSSCSSLENIPLVAQSQTRKPVQNRTTSGPIPQTEPGKKTSPGKVLQQQRSEPRLRLNHTNSSQSVTTKVVQKVAVQTVKQKSKGELTTKVVSKSTPTPKPQALKNPPAADPKPKKLDSRQFSRSSVKEESKTTVVRKSQVARDARRSSKDKRKVSEDSSSESDSGDEPSKEIPVVLATTEFHSVEEGKYIQQLEEIRKNEERNYANKVTATCNINIHHLAEPQAVVELPKSSRESSKSPDGRPVKFIPISDNEVEELRPRYADRVSEPEDDSDAEFRRRTPQKIITRPEVVVEEEEESKEALQEVSVKTMSRRFSDKARTDQVTDLDDAEPEEPEEGVKINVSVAERVNLFMENVRLSATSPQPCRPEDITLKGLDDTINEFMESNDYDDVVETEKMDGSNAVLKAKSMFETIAQSQTVTKTAQREILRQDDILSRPSVLQSKPTEKKDTVPVSIERKEVPVESLSEDEATEPVAEVKKPIGKINVELFTPKPSTQKSPVAKKPGKVNTSMFESFNKSDVKGPRESGRDTFPRRKSQSPERQVSKFDTFPSRKCSKDQPTDVSPTRKVSSPEKAVPKVTEKRKVSRESSPEKRSPTREQPETTGNRKPTASKFPLGSKPSEASSDSKPTKRNTSPVRKDTPVSRPPLTAATFQPPAPVQPEAEDVDEVYAREKPNKIPEAFDLKTPALLKKTTAAEGKGPQPRDTSPKRRESPERTLTRKDSSSTRTDVKNTTTTVDEVKFSKFGVSLKKTNSGNHLGRRVSEDVGKKENEIDKIFDLELLEAMLEKATGYEERRLIRGQIRIAKKMIETKELARDRPSGTPRNQQTDRSEKSNSVAERKRDVRSRSKSPEKSVGRVETRRQSKSPEKTFQRTDSIERKDSVKTIEVTRRRESTERVEKLRKSSGSQHSSELEAELRPKSSAVNKTIKKTYSDNENKEANMTDSITSSYGVGPTDDKGRPLFGLKALRRQTTGAAVLTETVVIETQETAARTEIKDSSGRALFGLKALKIPNSNDKQESVASPVEQPPGSALKDLVSRHDNYARGNAVSQPRQRPPARLRDTFLREQHDDSEVLIQKESEADEANRMAKDRQQSLKAMIQRHESLTEADGKRSEGTHTSSSRSSSTVVRSAAVRRADGTVSLRKEVIQGESVARDGQEPVTKVTRTEFSYDSPQDEKRGVSIKEVTDGRAKQVTRRSSTTDSVQSAAQHSRASSISSVNKTTRKSPSPDRSFVSTTTTRTSSKYTASCDKKKDETDAKTNQTRKPISDKFSQLSKKFSNDSMNGSSVKSTVVEQKTTQKTSVESAKDTRKRSTDTVISKASLKQESESVTARKSSVTKDDISETTTRRRSSTPLDDVKESLLRKMSSSNEESDVHNSTTFSRVARGGSVRALSQRFQQAAAESDLPKSGSSYPKAGLILRTTSFKHTNGDLTPTESPALHQSSSMEVRVGSPARSAASTPRPDQEDKTFVGNERDAEHRTRTESNRNWSRGEGLETRTTTTTRTVTQEGGGKSFLGSSTRVTGVQDIISRMRAADNEAATGDNLEDTEARALLNKFLGATVMMSGMEPLVAASGASSATLVSQVERQRILQSTSSQSSLKSSLKDNASAVVKRPKTPDNIEDIWDERKLRQLLDACSDYEGRRNIRARLRTVMAERSACEDIVAAARVEEKSNQSEPGADHVTSVQQQGESLLLPFLVEHLRSSLMLEPRSYSSQSSEEGASLPHVEDSGTESGEDLRLLAGLRDSIYEGQSSKANEPLGPGLLAEVQAALDKLQASLNTGTDSTLDVATRDTLLLLVSRLQTSLKLPSEGKLSVEPKLSKNRFANRRLLRQNRHTVGVTREELADARRLLEETSLKDKVPVQAAPAVPERRASPQQPVELDSTLPPMPYAVLKQSSAGDLLTAPPPPLKSFRPVHFNPVKPKAPGQASNAATKPFFSDKAQECEGDERNPMPVARRFSEGSSVPHRSPSDPPDGVSGSANVELPIQSKIYEKPVITTAISHSSNSPPKKSRLPEDNPTQVPAETSGLKTAPSPPLRNIQYAPSLGQQDRTISQYIFRIPTRQHSLQSEKLLREPDTNSRCSSRGSVEKELPPIGAGHKVLVHSKSLGESTPQQHPDSGSSLSEYDPSLRLFTPEQSVKIAVHKAAINKQLSVEEEKRTRKLSESDLESSDDEVVEDDGDVSSDTDEEQSTVKNPRVAKYQGTGQETQTLHDEQKYRSKKELNGFQQQEASLNHYQAVTHENILKKPTGHEFIKSNHVPADKTKNDRKNLNICETNMDEVKEKGKDLMKNFQKLSENFGFLKNFRNETQERDANHMANNLNRFEKRILEIQNEKKLQNRQNVRSIEELQKIYNDRKGKDGERRNSNESRSQMIQSAQAKYQKNLANQAISSKAFNHQRHHLNPEVRSKYEQEMRKKEERAEQRPKHGWSDRGERESKEAVRRMVEAEYGAEHGKFGADGDLSFDSRMDTSLTESEVSISSTSTENSVSHAQKLLQLATNDKPTRFYARSAKKMKMKRANTIDIPKPINFYHVEDDTDYSDDESKHLEMDQAMPAQAAAAGPVKPPVLQPKTDSDRRFLALLEQQKQPNAVQSSYWKKSEESKTPTPSHTKLPNDQQWGNRFSQIKTAFEGSKEEPKPSPVVMSDARAFWKTADDSATLKSKQSSIAAANGPRLSRQGSIFLKKLFQQKAEEQQPNVKLPWTGKGGPAEETVVIGSLTVCQRPTDRVNRVFSPTQPQVAAPVAKFNQFSHAPMSAFKPVERKTDVLIHHDKPSALCDYSAVQRGGRLVKPIADPMSPTNPSLPWIKDGASSADVHLNSTVAKFETLSSRETSPQLLSPKPKGKAPMVAGCYPPEPQRGLVRSPSQSKMIQARSQTFTPTYPNVTVNSLKADLLIPTPPLLSAPNLVQNYSSPQQNDSQFVTISKPYIPMKDTYEPRKESQMYAAQDLVPVTTYSVDVAATTTVYPNSMPAPHEPEAYQFLHGMDETAASTPEEHVAVARVMGGPVQQQAVTVKQKTHRRDDEEEGRTSAARSLATVLQRFSSPEDRDSSEPSPRGSLSARGSLPDIAAPRTLQLPPNLPTGKASPTASLAVLGTYKSHSVSPGATIFKNLEDASNLQKMHNFVPSQSSNNARALKQAFTDRQLPSASSRRTSSVESLVTTTSSEELREDGESVLTTRLQIPAQLRASSMQDLSPSASPSLSPQPPLSPNTVLRKSDSWHQLNGQPKPKRPQSLVLPDLPAPQRRTPTSLSKAKSSHALGFPKQFEAAMTPGAVETKQRTVQEFFSVKKHVSKAKKVPKVAEPEMVELDDNLENVDEAFDALFQSVTSNGTNGKKPKRKTSMPSTQTSANVLSKSISASAVHLVRNTRAESTVTTTTSDGKTTTTEVSTKASSFSATSSSKGTKAGATNTPVSPFAKFQQLDRQNSGPSSPSSPRSGNTPLFTFTDPKLSRSASGVKDRLLYWCQVKTKNYKNIQIENFSTSWSNGLAFCALIHHFLPQSFDYDSLNPKERRKNFELAFKVAEDEAGIAPLLDVEDMVMMRKPDWKCVFTYVQSIYRRFKDED